MTMLDTVFGWVCTASVRASMIVLVVLLVRQLWHSRLAARWKYALWLPVLLTLLIPPLPILPGWSRSSFRPFTIDRSSVNSQASDTLSKSENKGSGADRRNMLGHDAVLDDDSSSPTKESMEAVGGFLKSVAAVGSWLVNIDLQWSVMFSVLSRIWFAGAVGLVAVTVVSYHFTLRRIRRSAQDVDQHLMARIATVAAAVGLRQMPLVLNSQAVQSPAVCGVFRPLLLLHAQTLSQLTDDEIDMVLAHELTHIRRGDLGLNCLLCLLLAMHWFNPLLWIAFFSVRDDREAVCDDDVLRQQVPSRRIVYGNALLKLETEFAIGLSLPFVGMLQSQSRLKERIYLIAHYRKTGVFMKALLVFLVSLLTFIGIAKAGGLQQKPQKGDSGAITLQDPNNAKGLVSDEGEEAKADPSVTEKNGGSDEADSISGWGELAEISGLRSRLTIQTESPAVGKPLLFRLEVKNFGDRAAEIDPQTYAPFRVLRTEFADERSDRVPFIGAKVQTAASPITLKPGESLQLWEQVDLNDLFLLKDADTYNVYAEGGEWANQTKWRDSNRVRLELERGELQPEQLLLAELLPILPDEWHLSRLYGDIFFSNAPSNLKKDTISVQLLFRDEAMIQQLERQFSNKSASLVRIGNSRWGEAILVVPAEANPLWPDCREAIANVLKQWP